MQRRPSRTTAQKIRNLLPVLAVLLVLYGLASQNYLMLFSIGLCLLILWAAMHQDWIYRILQQILASFERPTPVPPGGDPSQADRERSMPEQPLYEQGYQEHAQPHAHDLPKEISPSEEQEHLQAQYPEQIPPMA